MIKRGRSRVAFTAIMFAVLMLAFSGCRASTALEQHIYSKDSEQMADVDINSLDNQIDNENKVDYVSPLQKQDDAEDLREQKRDTPVWGEDGTDKRETDKVEYDSNALGELDTESISKKDYRPNDFTGEESDQELVSEIDKGASISDSPDVKRIVDAYGELVELPANIQKISAVGEVANLIYMLGGGERLLASSESLSANALARNVFGEAKLAAVIPLWTGTGNQPLDEEKFKELLRMGLDVCFELSGADTFTGEQIAALGEAGISYVALPPLNTTENIATAISVLGEILGNEFENNAFDAVELASSYNTYCGELLDELGKRVDRYNYNNIDFNNDKYKYGVKQLPEDTKNSENGKFTLFITDWDEEAEYKLYSDERVTMRGVGVALTRSGYSNSPVCYYMSMAGVLNSSALPQDFNIESEWFVSPLEPSTRILAYNGGRGTTQLTDAQLTAVKVGDNGMAGVSRSSYVLLGSEEFPAIIVSEQYIKDKIMADPMWKVYGKITGKSGLAKNYGFPDEDGFVIKSNICGEYAIYVNPYGIGSWTDGSAESILEAVWVAYKFQNAYTEEEFTDIINDFYKRFYNYTLTESDWQLLLDGKDDSFRYDN